MKMPVDERLIDTEEMAFVCKALFISKVLTKSIGPHSSMACLDSPSVSSSADHSAPLESSSWISPPARVDNRSPDMIDKARHDNLSREPPSLDTLNAKAIVIGSVFTTNLQA